MRPDHPLAELIISAAGGEFPDADGGWRRVPPWRAGLEAIAQRKPDIVLIHDAARPFATPALVLRAINAAERTGAAIVNGLKERGA